MIANQREFYSLLKFDHYVYYKYRIFRATSVKKAHRARLPEVKLKIANFEDKTDQTNLISFSTKTVITSKLFNCKLTRFLIGQTKKKQERATKFP